MNKPDFIHIGPGRFGTTFLYKVFQSHPDIGLAKNIKETNFFTFNYHKGLDWYFKFFDYDYDVVKGEISPNYFYDISSIDRIKKNLPNVKIITILRNPFERMVSLYYYLIRSGTIAHDTAFNDIFKPGNIYLEQNLYS